MRKILLKVINLQQKVIYWLYIPEKYQSCYLLR